MENVIGAILLGIVATVCFVISYFQFNEKGFLFNNAYIYASKQEKETMDKKPHYKQSGIIFLMLGIVFFISVIEILIETGWLCWLFLYFYYLHLIHLHRLVDQIVNLWILVRAEQKCLIHKWIKKHLKM